jgi:hypothetical protein
MVWPFKEEIPHFLAWKSPPTLPIPQALQIVAAVTCTQPTIRSHSEGDWRLMVK